SHVDERVAGERIVGAVEVENPGPREPGFLALDAPVVKVRLAGGAGEGAGRRIDAGAAAVEVEDDLARVGPVLPEGELAAIGTLAVVARHDLVPPGIAGRIASITGRSWRQQRLTGPPGGIEYRRIGVDVESIIGEKAVLRIGVVRHTVVPHALSERLERFLVDDGQAGRAAVARAFGTGGAVAATGSKNRVGGGG